MATSTESPVASPAGRPRSVPAKPAPPPPMSVPKRMLLAAMAGTMAVQFSHPMDQTKTLLQLDGELAKRGHKQAYRGWMHCVKTTFKGGGLRGLYRGLSMSSAREAGMNSFRIGLYEPLVSIMPSWLPAPGVVAGATGAALGSMLVNPFEILKVRMQSAAGEYAGITQHGYKGAADAFRRVYVEEGFRGFFKGVNTSVVRLMVGSGSQLPTYHYLKKECTKAGMDPNSPWMHAGCSWLSAMFSVMCVNPFDVTRTRLYNQPVDKNGVGTLYKGGIDAALKLMSTEGPLAFYKGAFTHMMRLCPHLTLVFVFNEQLRRVV